MHRDLAYWKKCCATLDLRHPVVRWVLSNSGSVFMGGKPGELLTMDTTQFACGAEQALATLTETAQGWGLDVAVVQHCGTRVRVVIYHHGKVEADLRMVPGWALRHLGFPAQVSPTAFLRTIRERWECGQAIPHEIGFALGYPAKDVLGFMGLLNLDHTGECGWRVYGEPTESYERGRQFARAQALAMVCVA